MTKKVFKTSLNVLILGLFALSVGQCADESKPKMKITDYEKQVVLKAQDKYQALCTKYADNIPGDQFKAFMDAQKAMIQYPGGDSSKVVGDSKKGEKLYVNKKKGNCVACHCGHPKPELAACGNLGTSHKNYASQSGQKPKYTYDKIYNSWSILPCSSMYRMGVHGFLKPQDVADITAYLHDKNSNMNKQ